MEIQDQYGRSFKTLRVSLTNTCNLGCIYCTHSSEQNLYPNKTIQSLLNYKEIVHAIKSIHTLNPIDKLRLTGGEPTLYKDLVPIIKEISSIGISNIKMTSNGYLLKKMLPELAEAGLKEINISLDAVNSKIFNKISGRHKLDRVLEAVDESIKQGIKTKINAVILKGINDNQVLPLLKFSKERNITIRFLELMRMGPIHQSKDFNKYFTSEQEILDQIEAQYTFSPASREQSSTANYWTMVDGYKFGIIANESHPFCHDCDRLRLDSFGNIYGCLSNDTAISVTESLNDSFRLSENLKEALSHKQVSEFKGSAISMMAIGG